VEIGEEIEEPDYKLITDLEIRTEKLVIETSESYINVE
jgi:hypothetical protein